MREVLLTAVGGKGLTRLAKVVEEELGAAIADLPGAGAAGGLGGGLVALLGARLQPGFSSIARIISWN